MSDAVRELFAHGAQWLRADFHLHTRADKEFNYDGEKDRFIANYVDALKAAGTRHRLDRFLHAVTIGLPRVRDALSGNGAAQMVAKNIVLGVIAAGKGQNLRMRLNGVV